MAFADPGHSPNAPKDDIETFAGDVATHSAFLLRSSGVPDSVAAILTAR
jgi:hypothetical protein